MKVADKPDRSMVRAIGKLLENSPSELPVIAVGLMMNAARAEPAASPKYVMATTSPNRRITCMMSYLVLRVLETSRSDNASVRPGHCNRGKQTREGKKQQRPANGLKT